MLQTAFCHVDLQFFREWVVSAPAMFHAHSWLQQIVSFSLVHGLSRAEARSIESSSPAEDLPPSPDGEDTLQSGASADEHPRRNQLHASVASSSPAAPRKELSLMQNVIVHALSSHASEAAASPSLGVVPEGGALQHTPLEALSLQQQARGLTAVFLTAVMCASCGLQLRKRAHQGGLQLHGKGGMLQLLRHAQKVWLAIQEMHASGRDSGVCRVTRMKRAACAFLRVRVHALVGRCYSHHGSFPCACSCCCLTGLDHVCLYIERMLPASVLQSVALLSATRELSQPGAHQANNHRAQLCGAT